MIHVRGVMSGGLALGAGATIIESVLWLTVRHAGCDKQTDLECDGETF